MPWYFWQLKFSFCSLYWKAAAPTFSQMSLKARWENLSVNILEPWNMLSTHTGRAKILTKGQRCRDCLLKSGQVYWMVGWIVCKRRNRAYGFQSLFLCHHSTRVRFSEGDPSSPDPLLTVAWMFSLHAALCGFIPPGGYHLWSHKPVAGWVPSGKHQSKKTQGSSPPGEAVLLKVLSPKCKFLFPAWGSFIIPHRLRKVSPFPSAIHPSEKVPNRLIVPSLFQLPVSKLAFFFFPTSSVPRSVT